MGAATATLPRPLRVKVYETWQSHDQCLAHAYITSPNKPNKSYPHKDGIVLSISQWVGSRIGVEEFTASVKALVGAYNLAGD